MVIINKNKHTIAKLLKTHVAFSIIFTNLHLNNDLEDHIFKSTDIYNTKAIISKIILDLHILVQILIKFFINSNNSYLGY